LGEYDMASPIETAAQRFVYQPGRTLGIGTRLEGVLTAHYNASGMLQTLPAKANLLIEGGQRVAEWAAMWHVVISQLIRTTLPKLRHGQSIIPEDVSADRGPYHSFIDAGGTLLKNASAEVLGDTSRNGWGRYRPLWEQIGERQDRYKQRWLERKQELEEMGAVIPPTPPVEPGGKDKIEAIWQGSGAEIAKSALWALVNKRHSDPLGRVRSAEELARRSMAAVTILNRGTNMKRAVNLRLFPNLFEDLPQELGESFFLPEEGAVFVDDGVTTCKWAHAALSSESQTATGNCPGKIWLRPSRLKDRNNAEGLFVIGEEYGGVPIPRPRNGTYNGGLAMLVLGDFMAEETIYADGESND
jgi:hypothetical protein